MPRALRRLCALFALAIALSAGSVAVAAPARVVGRQQTDAVELDLAAMVPTPGELGLPGFSIEDGVTHEVADKAAELAASSGKSVEDRTALLERIGWVRSYRARFVALGGTGEPFAHLVMTTVVQYADETTAAAGLQAQLTADTGAGVSDVAGAPTIGDASGLRRIDAVSLDQGAPFGALLAAFRRGTMVADAFVFDRGSTPIDETRGEAVAAAFLDRVDGVLAHGGPGLSRAILRVLSSKDPYFDNYEQLDGSAFRRWDDEDDDFARRQRVDAEVLAGYNFVPELGDEVTISLSLRGFADSAAAERWLTAFPAALAAVTEVETQWSPVVGAQTFGDESLTLTISGEGYFGYEVAARVGEFVATIEIDASGEVPLEAVEELTVAQVGCLDAVTCPAVPVPAALSDLMAGGTPTP